MTDQYDRSEGPLGRFAAARGSGDAAGGLVHVELDGTGDLSALDLDPRVMRLPSEDLAAAIREAFGAARAALQAALQEQLAAQPVTLPQGLGPLLNDLGFGAQRRLDDLAAAAQQIADRLDRMGGAAPR
ncbi:YbaB/EbfC family nucleoid-associated protein [Micromonospora sp. 4G57]|uniref:YbaB/EbfC family nucleoid-associated protein n=1 Tax=Micromonospora sicca TaxID=2202420 RepID=A0ABU5JBS5_9ACTN|nr:MULTISPECIES: YbaB/EbfC family nucleoid-associated protein [unclassified Micromonospora]MDZ5445626.1 YbaB/EbfC family nucleoid-associated protein [Micromonospora sp. 4G57]MDZ5490044.1 YbaB/EbfC family nucleoid-associated protein [Micromonospora sp. 4G53]